MAKQFTAAQRHALMTRLLATAGGRARIAQSLTGPLRTLRDYMAVGRKAFTVDVLPDGTLPVYDTDPEVPAYVVAEEGHSIEEIIKAKRIILPMVEIAAYPKIPFTQIKERRFDIVTRVKLKAQSEIFRAEDRAIFNLMKAAADNNPNNPLMSVPKADYNIDVLADAFAEIEKHGLRVDKVFMNPAGYKVLRKAGRDYLNDELIGELMRTGYGGTLWGASVFQSSEIPAGYIFVVTEPEYLGTVAERLSLTIMSADSPAERMVGWSIFQNAGYGLHNSKGIQGIKLT